MENASDALIMAGQVLVFIIALTVCISSFSTLRIGIDSVINQTDTIRFAKESDLYINYIQSRDNKSTRIVGAETVVSSLYRSIKEDYTLYLVLKDSFDIVISKIDYYNSQIRNGSSEEQNRFSEILYKEIDNKLCIKFKIGGDANAIPDTILKLGLYDELKERSFYEFIGEYQENTDQAVSSENKLVKRVITYEEKT